MRKFLITCILGGVGLLAFGNDSLRLVCAEMIDNQSLRQHVITLASDEYEGRGAGEPGQKKAAQYIAQEFKNLGLQSVNADTTSYLQPFDMGGKSGEKEEIYIKMGDFNKLGKLHFYTEGDFLIPRLKTEVIWMGYGIDSPQYSDYQDIDVTGKVVMALIAEPKLSDGRYLISQTYDRSEWSGTYQKIKTAKAKGATSIFLVHPTEYDFIRFKNRAQTLRQMMRKRIAPEGVSKSQFGVFYLRPKSAGRIFKKTRKKFFKMIGRMNPHKKSSAGTFRNDIEVMAVRRSFTNKTENVIGFVEGSDLKNEIVVVGAHYDHLGIAKDIYNGADDNASGTSALLTLAQAFAKAKATGKGPRRSLLFIAFSGEEKGLLGSYYYTMNPVIPLDSTKVYINMDMIGRGKTKRNKVTVYVVGDHSITSVNEQNAQLYAPNIKLNYSYNSKSDPEQLYYRSDHYNFSKFGIPFIYYTTGFHADYHKPSDDSTRINFQALQQLTHLIFHTTWDLANSDL